MVYRKDEAKKRMLMIDTMVESGFAWQKFAILLALHLPGDEVAFIITHFIWHLFTLPQDMVNLSPRVVAVYKEVSNYLGELATITKEKRVYSWISVASSLSPEAQTALTTSLLGLALKLTGAKLDIVQWTTCLPGGLPGVRSRTEVVTYLALIQVCRLVTHGFPILSLSPTQKIVDAMAGSWNWMVAARNSQLDKMYADITKIVADF